MSRMKHRRKMREQYNGVVEPASTSRHDLNRRGPDGQRIYITLEDALQRFGIPKGELLRGVRENRIPHEKIEGRVYFNRIVLVEYLGQ